MNDTNTAFIMDIDIDEETLLSMTKAVDDLDSLRIFIGGVLVAPERDWTLEQYVTRATQYLGYLLDRIREEDLQQISTGPMEEGTRQRIARVLRSSTQVVQS
jgi:hypothetical protein